MRWCKVLSLVVVMMISADVSAQNLITLSDSLSTFTYAQDYHCPLVTSWMIHSHDLQGSVGRSSSRFTIDDRLPSPQVTHDDFNKTGYDRGHMVPSEDRQSSSSINRLTFRTSNVAPQLPSLNRGQWKHTENVCRQLAMRHDSVRVEVHAIFTPHWVHHIGAHAIRVPDHFRKVVRKAANDSVIYIWDICNHE